VELLQYIIKNALICSIILPFVIIKQWILYKKGMKMKWFPIVIAYIIVVAIFVLNEYYDFITRL
jgi:hypothetical protein